MYNPKKKLPVEGEEVLVLLETATGPSLHEGYLMESGEWYIYKYDAWRWKVLGWKHKPRLDAFTDRFLFFALGFASAVAFVYTAVCLMG